ncbi:uncharacterized protein [Diadema antillarum]|uniref:uncharacterized protein n=1 Tax=Diadema antillarum TaxID=105358 RepID=UPI003A8411FB
MVQKVTPKHEIVSAAAVAACVVSAPATVPKSSASTRWQDKGAKGRSKSDRDDWKKAKKLKVEKFDDFQEWIDGDLTMRYHPKDVDARKHLSGWAMRNTNNHNKKVLKKSCLGVFICSKQCRTSTGDIVTVRPATSDRARRKQADKKCPRTGCDGKLVHQICAGKSGYPVTHFWRVTDTVILFQAKGIHDHPRPDVVKTTSQAKMALLEYHRTHRHERPKEICKKVGVHIHKSFNRVDRVARQLREVQNTDGGEAPMEVPKEPYTLRSHLRSLWSGSAQRQGEADNHQLIIGQGSFQNTYNRQPGYTAYTYPGTQLDGWGQYTATQDDYSAFINYKPIDGHHQSAPMAPYQPGNYTYSAPLHSSDGTTYDYNFNGNVVLSAPAAQATAKTHEELEVGAIHGVENAHKQSFPTAYPGYSADFGLILPSQASHIDLTPLPPSYIESSTASPNHHNGHTTDMTPVKQSGLSPLKRPAPPDLHSLQEAKQPRLSEEQSTSVTASATIKLAEHTPSINIDLSSFSDIFDIPAGLGDEGLAGRPKTPVYQSLSPAAPTRDGDSAAADVPRYSHANQGTEEDCSSPNLTDDNQPLAEQADGNSSTMSSPMGSEESQASGSHSSPPPSSHSPPNAGPVLATLSTHAPSNVPVTTAPASNDKDNFIDQLVSMYLGKEDKSISTMKSELHVYTESQTGQRAYAYHGVPDDHAHAHVHAHAHAHAMTSQDHFRSPITMTGHGTSGHFDYSWSSDRSQAYRPSTGLTPVTDSLISPLMSGHFDYSTSITDFYNSHHAAVAATSSSHSASTAYAPSCQSPTTPIMSSTFSHVTTRHLF